MLGHQLVVLFGKVVEHLRGGALLKEVVPWGKALSLYNLTPLPVYSLLLEREHNMASHFCHNAFQPRWQDG